MELMIFKQKTDLSRLLLLPHLIPAHFVILLSNIYRSQLSLFPSSILTLKNVAEGLIIHSTS